MADALLKAYTQQQSPAVSGDGQFNAVRQTRTGELFAADWKTALAMRGKCYHVTVGSVAAGGNVAMITGGGAGTTVDSDKPELIVQTPATHFHIPLSCRCAIQADLGAADLDEANIVLFADTSPAALISTATATSEVPVNLLGGGAGSISTVFSAVTADITDPTSDMILDFSTVQAAEVAADGTISTELKMIFEPQVPIFLKGLCAVVLCWGGTAAAVGMATYTWAEVPISEIA